MDMTTLTKQIKQHTEAVVEEWLATDILRRGDLFVIGCSTSEVAGERIGTKGSEDIASIIFSSLKRLQQQAGVHFAFQCCEHLNRSLVMERKTKDLYYFLEEVAVIPTPKAGGSMAAYAFKQMVHPVVVEAIQADAGMDIGETMIGMHLKNVAIPLRLTQAHIGHARLNAARTRPKLIGGARALYHT